MEFLTPGSRGIFALGCVLGIAETHLLHRAPPLLSIADSVSIMGDLFRLSLARYINGYPFKPVDWSDRGRPIIRIQNLSDPDADPNFFEGEIPEVYLVKRGDLLLSWSATLGAFEWPGPDAWLNQHIFKVDLDTNRVSKKYYRWLAEWFMRELDSEAHGSTMQHLTKDRFGGFKLQLPPPALQETISNYLDRETTRIDGLIAEKERMLALLEEKRAALVSRVVTRGLDPHAPLKPSGQEWLGEIPAHWAIRPIKYLAVIGNGSTPSVENADYWDDEGYPWLNSSVVNVSPVTDASRFVTETALRECHLPKIQPPAVLVGITGQGKTRGMVTLPLQSGVLSPC